jgi:hypothetical protein
MLDAFIGALLALKNVFLRLTDGKYIARIQFPVMLVLIRMFPLLCFGFLGIVGTIGS